MGTILYYIIGAFLDSMVTDVVNAFTTILNYKYRMRSYSGRHLGCNIGRHF